jgi:CMP-N-acetylneuraminic acid synthetase
MKKENSTVCVIPSRSQGDSINNLNFLNVGNQMLLELTINSAMKSKLFNKIFVIFDNNIHKNLFEKKYNILGIVDKKRMWILLS